MLIKELTCPLNDDEAVAGNGKGDLKHIFAYYQNRSVLIVANPLLLKANIRYPKLRKIYATRADCPTGKIGRDAWFGVKVTYRIRAASTATILIHPRQLHYKTPVTK